MLDAIEITTYNGTLKYHNYDIYIDEEHNLVFILNDGIVAIFDRKNIIEISISWPIRTFNTKQRRV